jgi:hypothetical protein
MGHAAGEFAMIAAYAIAMTKACLATFAILVVLAVEARRLQTL